MQKDIDKLFDGILPEERRILERGGVPERFDSVEFPSWIVMTLIKRAKELRNMTIPVQLFLTAKQVGEGPENAVEGVIKEVNIIPKDECKFDAKEDKVEISIELDKEVYVWTANNKTLRLCANEWGKEEANWIDKHILLWSVKQQVFKDMKDVIYGSPYVEP